VAIPGPWDLVVVTGPSIEPITRAEAKEHLRVDHNAEDAYIDGLVVACREWLEKVSGRALLTQTVRQVHSGFPGGRTTHSLSMQTSDPIPLLRYPVQSISAITYLDDDDATQTVGASVYRLEADTAPCQVVCKVGQSWPIVLTRPGAVKITYVAGATAADQVPQMAKHLIKLLLGHFYENREETISGTIIAKLPRGVRDLLWQFRVNIIV
jgi:uncharacterized phiE125 gp8 family phage protein